MELTPLTLVLLASVAHIAFSQTSLDELSLNACQIYTNKTLAYDFVDYVIARHSIYEDVHQGQQRIILTCSNYVYAKLK